MAYVEFMAGFSQVDELDNRVQNAQLALEKNERKMANQERKVISYAMNVMHIGNIVSSVIERTFENTKASLSAHKAGQLIQLASSQLGVINMGLEATAMAIKHNWWGFARMTATAAMMQINIVQQQAIMAQTEAQQQANERIQQQMEAFR
jgi:hypothetical protein